MKNTPIERRLIDETIEDFHIADFAKATIREVKAIAAKAEAASGVEFIKMEMGVPGLPPSVVGVKAEIDALQQGIASLYPGHQRVACIERRSIPFHQSIHQCRCGAGRLCARNRLHAGNFCLIPYMQPV